MSIFEEWLAWYHCRIFVGGVSAISQLFALLFQTKQGWGNIWNIKTHCEFNAAVKCQINKIFKVEEHVCFVNEMHCVIYSYLSRKMRDSNLTGRFSVVSSQNKGNLPTWNLQNVYCRFFHVFSFEFGCLVVKFCSF